MRILTNIRAVNGLKRSAAYRRRTDDGDRLPPDGPFACLPTVAIKNYYVKGSLFHSLLRFHTYPLYKLGFELSLFFRFIFIKCLPNTNGKRKKNLGRFCTGIYQVLWKLVFFYRFDALCVKVRFLGTGIANDFFVCHHKISQFSSQYTENLEFCASSIWLEALRFEFIPSASFSSFSRFHIHIAALVQILDK